MSYPEPPKPKAEIRRSGIAIAEGRETGDDIERVDAWRASHGYVINTFQAWFRRNLTRTGINVEFAQRLKRRRTVIDKLKRKKPDGHFLISDVTSMHDFAGCRLIFETLEDLNAFRLHMHSSTVTQNVKHTLKNSPEKYDYIAHPKSSGYRGIHDVYRHIPRPHRSVSNVSEPWHNLLVEVQYRTRVQHAWATALEISDIIDGKRTKFEFEENPRVRFFAIASEILARSQESLPRSFTEKELPELQEDLKNLEEDLGILQRLKALREFKEYDDLGKHNVLNITKNSGGDLALKVYKFRSPNQAIEKANALESDDDSINAVYVRADNPQQLRSAYRNYFNDPLDFVRMLEGVT